jgi:signal transduction histidine kinase
MSSSAAHPARRRRWSTVAAWVATIASPFLLELVMLSRLPGPARFVLPFLAMLLPWLLLRRHPFVGLAALLTGLFMLTTVNPDPPTAGPMLPGLPDGSVRIDDSGYSVGNLLALREVHIAVVVLAIGWVAVHWRRRVSIPFAAVALVVQVFFLFAFPVINLEYGTIVVVLLTVVAWVIGHSVRQRRQFTATQREQRTAQAVQAERLRIARELHDMVAHNVGVIAIQAGVGARVIDSQPAEARNSLTAIEATSRDTLAGLRRMLGSLRQSDPEAGTAPLGPAPGLAELDTLVARAEQAGVRVALTRSGDTELPPDVDLAAYRIVQEAVTNVIRHAGTDRCRIELSATDTEVRIVVTDDGSGGPVGAGYGIAGMRERVALLHGEFDAGPCADGGFRVAATIPVPA